jgi:rhamnose utilization protein RhaD (predicted bifunctional aldolase and dehydrogenase)
MKSQDRELVESFCFKYGLDRLFVQGAGGNVSWKDEDTLWIKASGTQLSDAKDLDIFVPIFLNKLLENIKKNDFESKPIIKNNSKAKPSIDIFIHALMPQKYVVHLHAVEVLASLVQTHFLKRYSKVLNKSFNWKFIKYTKPGIDLALAIKEVLKLDVKINILFLQNHGIVIGAESMQEVEDLLKKINTIFQVRPKKFKSFSLPISKISSYQPIMSEEIHNLAIQTKLFNNLSKNWALYPDHVVFLGPKPFLFSSWQSLNNFLKNNNPPNLVFIQGHGVFANSFFTTAQEEQLYCFFDVLVRQNDAYKVNALTKKQINELINWDAERYRINLSEK